MLEFLLQDYDCPFKPALLLGFKSGFRIHSSIGTDPLKGIFENHKSVNHNLSFVQTKLDKEKSLGRVAGPFPNPPLSNMVFSPLGLVPKKEPGDFRLIHDLSYPQDNSVNSHIGPEFSAVSFEMLDDSIRIMLELGKGCFIDKADLKDAFRIIPISPLDYHLLGFKFKGQFYFDMCLPMGCSTSCQTFESLSRVVQWICVHKAKSLHISHIIDDFIMFGTTISRCQLYLGRFFDICRKINLPVKHSKTVLPTSTAVLHGIEVDSIAETIKLPQDTFLAQRAKLIAMSKRKKISLRDVQSLEGSFMFSSRVIYPGSCFCRRLYNLTIDKSNPNHMVRLNREARRDIMARLEFLATFNGTMSSLLVDRISSDVLHLTTDASSFAFGAVFGNEWLQGSFPERWSASHISVKELLPIILAVRCWGSLFANQRILFLSDNTAVVEVINKPTNKQQKVTA